MLLITGNKSHQVGTGCFHENRRFLDELAIKEESGRINTLRGHRSKYFEGPHHPGNTANHPSSNLFCSLAVLNPRVGHTMYVLSPFISVFCHTD